MSVQAEDVDHEPVEIKEEPIEIDIKVKEEVDEFLEVLPSTSKCVSDDDKDVERASLKIEPDQDTKILPGTSKIDIEDDLFEEDGVKKEKSELKEEMMSDGEDIESDFEPEGLTDDIEDGTSIIKTEELMIKSESGDSDTRSFNERKAKTGSINCDKCDFNTHSQIELKKHLLVHINNNDMIDLNYYICYICDFSTHNKRSLRKHIVVKHIKSTVKNHSCNICDYKTHYGNSLKQHIEAKHKVKPATTYDCDMCNYKTHVKNYLASHKWRKHSVTPVKHVKKHSCNFCDYKTHDKSNLRSHILGRHDKNADKRYKCDRCDFQTHYSGAISMHIKNVHETDVKNHVCVDCGYKTKSEYFLIKHKVYVHDKEAVKKYVCDLCNYRGHFASDLRRHNLSKRHKNGIILTFQ